MRVAYIASRYPLVSHAFIAREVDALRAQGVDVDTFTVRRSERGGLISEADRAEDARTFALRPISPAALLAAHAWALRRSPRAYLRALGAAWRGRAPGARGALWAGFYLAEAVVLARELSGRDIRHVHAHHANVAADVARIAARYLGATWSVTIHGPREFDEPDRARPGFKAAEAAFAVCISEYCAAQVRALVPSGRTARLHVVHAGVGVPPGTPPLPRPGGALRVLSVGQLAERKGFGVLLDALGELRERGVPVSLTIVGDGPAREALETGIAARGLGGAVTLAGALAHPATLAAYAEADAFCLPSFAEGVPVVLMEAMARARPVVATDIAGVPELVDDGRSGLLVPPGSAGALADAVAALAADPDLRARFGAAGREKVIHDYDLAASARALRGLFESVGA